MLQNESKHNKITRSNSPTHDFTLASIYKPFLCATYLFWRLFFGTKTNHMNTIINPFIKCSQLQLFYYLLCILFLPFNIVLMR